MADGLRASLCGRVFIMHTTAALELCAGSSGSPGGEVGRSMLKSWYTDTEEARWDEGLGLRRSSLWEVQFVSSVVCEEVQPVRI